MAERKKKAEVTEAVPNIDTELFLSKLEGMLQESCSVADHFRDNSQNRWECEYVKGRLDAYIEIAERVFSGDFYRNSEEV